MYQKVQKTLFFVTSPKLEILIKNAFFIEKETEKSIETFSLRYIKIPGEGLKKAHYLRNKFSNAFKCFTLKLSRKALY
jgi:hypothetical protein